MLKSLWQSKQLLFLMLLIPAVFISIHVLLNNSKKETGTKVTVLSENTVSQATLAPTSSAENLKISAVASQKPKPTPTPSPTQSGIVLSKKLYKIAAIGDSMIETIGGNLDYLYKALKKKYPYTDFYMYNYGIGSENVIEGLARYDKPFKHADRSYPSIAEVKPDIIVVGSYAYNPPTNYNVGVYRNSLTQIINKSKAITPNVYLLAEIAPLEMEFGKGPGGVNWPPELVNPHVAKIVELMANARSLPHSLGITLIDVYTKTTHSGSVYGREEFVDPHDNIHPSAYGHTFMAETSVSTIILK